MKRFSILLAVFAVIASDVIAQQNSFEKDGYVFKILDDDKATCAIIGGTRLDKLETGDDRWINFPNDVYFTPNKKTYTVIEIGPKAFNNKKYAEYEHVERIIFPNKLEAIGEEAFAGTKVKRIRFPKTLRKIGNGAFRNSFTLGCNLPDALQELGDSAFLNYGLTDGFAGRMNAMTEGIRLGSGPTKIGNAAFSGNIPNYVAVSPESNSFSLDSLAVAVKGKPLKLYTLFDRDRTSMLLMLAFRINYIDGTLNLSPDSISVEYRIPSTVTRIEDYAFTGESYYASTYWTWRLNGGVSRIYIPESVTYLGKYSLSGIGGGDIIFEGSVPPDMPEPAFFTGSELQDGARLYARKEAIDAFKANEQWAGYEILPIEYVGIDRIETDNSAGDSEGQNSVHDIYGRIVMQNASISDLKNLEKGIYIYNGKKIFI